MLRTFALATILAVGSACAMRMPGPSRRTLAEPHVSWIIMFGDQDNPDREFACQSEPLTDCVLPPSRPEAPVVSAVHFYYHRAGTDTNYSGVNKIGFFQGPGGQVQPNITVKGDDAIANQSITGIVTAEPGTYELSIAVVTTSGSDRRPVSDRVAVVVK
jgi:hypothetical protein